MLAISGAELHSGASVSVVTVVAFEFYMDQVEALRRLSLDQKMHGGRGRKSRMVRDAIDQYVAKSHRRSLFRPRNRIGSTNGRRIGPKARPVLASKPSIDRRRRWSVSFSSVTMQTSYPVVRSIGITRS